MKVAGSIAAEREQFEQKIDKLAAYFKKLEGQPAVFDKSYGKYFRIEIVLQVDGVYRLDHVVTANQKTIFKAFGIDANYIKRKTEQISNELNPRVLKVKIRGNHNGKKI